MEKSYLVLQGKITKAGVGCLHLQKEFTNLKDARKYFNEIKKDDRGWVIDKTEHLETAIILEPKNWENEQVIETYIYKK